MTRFAKTALALLTAALLSALLFCGCAEEGARKYRVGVSQCSAESWRWKTNDEILRENMFHDDIEVEIRCADDQNEKQISDIRYFIDNGFDLIIANPNQADALTPIIKEAYDRGIPVITFDRRINGDSYTVHIEVDNEEIGRNVARYALDILPDRRVNIIEIQGDSAMSPTKKRHSGFASEMGRHPDIHIIASEYANWKPEVAAEITDSLLDLYPDVDLVYAHSDKMAISAAETARRKGRGGIKFLGIDGNAEVGIKAVSDSVLDATFLYPTYGYKLLRTAEAILKGEKVSRDVTVPPLPAVDKSNADILLQQDALVKEETNKIVLLKDKLDDFWQRHSAQTYLLYAAGAIVALLCGVIFLLWRTYWQHRRHQQALTEQNRLLQEERDKQKVLYRQLQEATQSKMVFFTNVSHDLRTPLTLIAEPIAELLARSGNAGERELSLLKLANKNIRILRRLIDQILDFRKYESGKLEARLEEVRFYPLIKEWIESFGSVIRKKDIKLSADIPDDPDFTIAVDPEKIERVFFNIMSNAIKHTPDNGRILVECRANGGSLVFSVTDSGEGIAAGELDRVFENFYQADKAHPEGSGIGLAVAKAFVELHGGAIKAESEPKKGAKFTVTLPITHSAPEAAETPHLLSAAEVDEELDDVNVAPRETGGEKPVLLAIDDNKDILQLITGLMGDDYEVICASNGRQGIKLASKYTPDVIVCDVMMPVMDGLECCRTLKSEISTSHIPVLLLTACSMDEQRLSGYESGADGYLSKPFNGDLLKVRCRNLIENRRRIKELGSQPVTAKEAAPKRPSPAAARKISAPGDVESEFYNRFLTIVEKGIGNAELSIEDIAGQMNLGKSQLSRKIKALTNYTPVEIIRDLRLKKARQLLLSTEKSVSEIAYEVGFSQPAYFSKCYKDAYGESPSDLRSRLGADK